jgi:hypothetical protein
MPLPVATAGGFMNINHSTLRPDLTNDAFPVDVLPALSSTPLSTQANMLTLLLPILSAGLWQPSVHSDVAF